jgi:hypothetical protein
LGILFTWVGSVIGEKIRPMIHKEHLELDFKKGFLIAYIFYIIILLMVWRVTA